MKQSITKEQWEEQIKEGQFIDIDSISYYPKRHIILNSDATQ